MKGTYRELLKAKQIAQRYHAGQVDKAGMPYIGHARAVASMVDTPLEKTVAWLHDIVEDTDVTFEMLHEIGFGEYVIEAVSYLTHREGVPYMDYIKSVAANETARHVKMADLKHNMDLSRLPTVTEKDFARQRKYEKALKYLVNYERMERGKQRFEK